MVTEIAYLTIDPARSEQFEAAVEAAAPFFKGAEGCLSMALERVVEDPAKYRLVVGWETVDHHMVTFRESEGFQKWRELAGPFFVETPTVEHWDNAVSCF